MRFVVLALALIVGSAATSEAQVFKPRGKGALAKKADPSLKPTSDAKKPEVAKAAAPAPVASRKVTTKPKKSGAKKKKHRSSDDDDVKVSDDSDDDVKVSDD